jgi:MFS family permease
VGLFWGCFAAYVPEVKMRLGVSDASFGLLLLCNAFGLVSSMWIAPRLDRLLGARGMQISGAVFAITLVLPGLAVTPLQFAVSMVTVGAASGLADVLMNARVSELEQKFKRPLMNANHGMFSLAYAAAAFTSGLAREAQMAPSIAFVCVGFMILFLSLFIFMPLSVQELPTTSETNYPFWPILICGLIVLIAFMTEATVETWSALHIERTLLGRASEGALGPAMLGITMAFGRFTGQAIIEKFSQTSIIIVATLVTASGAGIAALAPNALWAYFGFAVLGLGVSVIGPLGLAMVGQKVSDHLRTEAISRVAVLGFSGFFLAPVLMGLVSEVAGLRIAFLCTAGLSLVLIPLTLSVRKM